MDDEVQVV
jgi:hypothetical protein